MKVLFSECLVLNRKHHEAEFAAGMGPKGKPTLAAHKNHDWLSNIGERHEANWAKAKSDGDIL